MSDRNFLDGRELSLEVVEGDLLLSRQLLSLFLERLLLDGFKAFGGVVLKRALEFSEH